MSSKSKVQEVAVHSDLALTGTFKSALSPTTCDIQANSSSHQWSSNHHQPGDCDSTSGSSAASSIADDAPPSGSSRRYLGGAYHPDYEIPEGRLSETEVVNHLHVRTDKYGFILNSTSTATTDTTPATTWRTAKYQRRVKKWNKMFGPQGSQFASFWKRRPEKVKQRVRKGIPDEFRGRAWLILSGGRELLLQNAGAYDQLVQCEDVGASAEMDIMKDLGRTLPGHVLFLERQGLGQAGLFHVLRAYCAYDRAVGYVQGMAFLCATLLLFLTEEEAFWTLVAIMQGPNRGSSPMYMLFTRGFPLLEQYMFQFQELMTIHLPKLANHLSRQDVEPALYCINWFNTLFTYRGVPFQHVLRIWDIFMLEGPKTIFRVALALMQSAQERLLRLTFNELCQDLGQMNFPILAQRPSKLVKAALRFKRLSRLLNELELNYQKRKGQHE